MINAVPSVEQTAQQPPHPQEKPETIVDEIVELEEEVVSWFDQVSWYWRKVATFLLTAHVVWGLWESINFMVIEYPQLEKSLALHLVAESTVHEITVNAIILMVTTAINIVMAMRLNSVKEDQARLIDLIVATVLIITTPFLQMTLNSLPILEIMRNALPL